MIHISTSQLLRLWSELDDAYYGKNRFGGDTAEIYAYTLQPADPSRNPSLAPEHEYQEAERYAALQAAQTLFHVLCEFEKIRECSVLVNGKIITHSLAHQPFEHRVHIKVQKTSVA